MRGRNREVRAKRQIDRWRHGETRRLELRDGQADRDTQRDREIRTKRQTHGETETEKQR